MVIVENQMKIENLIEALCKLNGNVQLNIEEYAPNVKGIKINNKQFYFETNYELLGISKKDLNNFKKIGDLVKIQKDYDKEINKCNYYLDKVMLIHKQDKIVDQIFEICAKYDLEEE